MKMRRRKVIYIDKEIRDVIGIFEINELHVLSRKVKWIWCSWMQSYYIA